MFIVLGFQTPSSSVGAQCSENISPLRGLGAWTGDDYKHCAPDGAFLRRRQAGQGLIQWQCHPALSPANSGGGEGVCDPAL